MTSTLYVDNLIEKTSGNGVHIPGHIIQTHWHPVTASFDSTVNAYITQSSTTFTPKFTGSKIVVEWSGHVYKYNSVVGGNSAARLLYAGSTLWQNNYLTYLTGSSGEYMYSGLMRGVTTSANTSAATVSFDISAGSQGRQYVYGNTGGIYIQEIAQ
jgi:hypothetical protein